MLLRLSIATHINGNGYGLFQFKQDGLKLIRFEKKSRPIDLQWIRKVRCIVEGEKGIPFLHRDVRTPFGEMPDSNQVEQSLKDVLGDNSPYKINEWHSYFVEDTNLGSSHRIFTDLNQTNQKIEKSRADYKLPLELAILSLGEEIFNTTGFASFQFVFYSGDFIWSLLFCKGSPLHILRITKDDHNYIVDRLGEHKNYLANQFKDQEPFLRIVLSQTEIRKFIDPGLDENIVEHDFNFAKPKEWDTGSALLHYGLALSSRNVEHQKHSRTSQENLEANRNERSFHSFLFVMFFSLLIGGIVSAASWYNLRQERLELTQTMKSAQIFETEIAIIDSLRDIRSDLVRKVYKLKPVWRNDYDWESILNQIAASLPKNSGIDALMAERNPQGMNLNFKAWVSDWAEVEEIQNKLSNISKITEVKISEQRKDPENDVVIFQVQCNLEAMP